jgi:hypothetical protein
VITIVSGLPRSGTSLMMQMLDAGGLPITTDGRRAPDEHNPHGYLEDERVKRLPSESSWVATARGSALKVVAPLLPFLPGELSYRVIWMERALDEVLASQRRMLERSGDPAAETDEASLRSAFESQRARVRDELRRRGTPLLEIQHRDAIARPAETARRVAGFLGLELDIAAAAAVVDPSLHRQRSDAEGGSPTPPSTAAGASP